MKLSSLSEVLRTTLACLPGLQRKTSRRACYGLGLMLMLGLSTTTQALKPGNSPYQDQLQIRPSVDEVARQINQQPKWRVLEAGPTVEDKKTMYRFKLLDRERGSVKVFIIDPTDPLFKNLHLSKP